MNSAGSDDRLRIDLWLWRARFFKTRALAGAAAAKGRMRITRNGRTDRIEKSSAAVRIGDVLTFERAKALCIVEILGLPVRRGPAAEAQAAYRNLAVSPGARASPD